MIFDSRWTLTVVDEVGLKLHQVWPKPEQVG